MEHKTTIRYLLILGVALLAVNPVFASPSIQIHSPENITYNSTKILVNVTSSEPVTFLFKDLRTGKTQVLAENTSALQNYAYAREGGYELIIWANNSNGTVNQSIAFSTTAHNPVEINDCGIIVSSDTSYVVVNDISTTDHTCLGQFTYLRNVSINLNGHKVSGGYAAGIRLSGHTNIKIFNGTLSTDPFFFSSSRPDLPEALEVDGSKLELTDLLINAHIGLFAWKLDDSLFKNVTFNSSVGVEFWGMSNVYLVNTSFIWNGNYPGITDTPVAILDESTHATLYLENTTFKDFPAQDMNLRFNTDSDYFLRNTKINLSRVKYSDLISTTRFFRQHLIVFDIKDQFNESGSGVVEISDNGQFKSKQGIESVIDLVGNPTAKSFVATDSNGQAETWLTERLVLTRTSSPPQTYEYDFWPYNLIARSWNNTQTKLLNLSSNSTILVTLVLNMSVQEQIPECTVATMLDLNGDNTVNIQDATLILRKITGLNVSTNATRDCKGITLNWF